SIGSVQAVGGDVVYGPPAANPVAGKETGDISRLDIENSLRFNNLLTTLNLTAAGLHQVLEHGVAASGPGQTQGRYPQVSGVRFSYDQTLAPGARLLNAIIVDENDITLDTLVHEGMLHGDPGRVFRVVTLNFLSTGGDGYPFSTLGWDLVDLPTLPDAGPQQADFAVAGSEQDAFAEYIRHFHSAPGAEYAMAETPASEDHRIQEVNHRTDCILPPLYYADVDGDGYGDPNVFVTNCPGGAPDGHVTDNTDDCPLIAGRAGDSCDDGDPNTINDLITADCNCVGTPVGDCTNDLTIEFVTDANGTEIAWAIEPLAGGDALCGGAGLPSNAVVTADCCLPDGCYRLVVTDAGGDGIAGGGYVLRTADGERIIDNTGNFSTGSVSSVADGFCLPLGDDRPISTSCDRTWWQSGNYLVAAGNPAVSAEFGVSNATSGYEFWFYDPNGGLSFRKFRNHATSDGFAPNNAMRAAHIKLNNWAAANHLQDNVLYNVRIRGVVDGTELPYGPACRVVLDPVAAACTPTGLNDIAGHPNFSCGVSRTWGGPNSMANRLYARSVGGANKYQFEFSNADEGYLAVVQSNTVIRHLNWSSQPALNVGSTYQVRVRASKDGGTTWCNWGWACEVTIAPGVAPGGESFAALGQAGVSLWPNPNNGQQLWMEVAGLTDDVRTIAIDIHDLSGKRVIAREVKAQHGAMNMDLDGLAAGTYVVAITAGDQRFVERLVIAD
ncbi:MAG: 5'-nucleotidase C-terminal domain-containing protein, partial [Flavobacteriales bacterium]|nr:5'-nucleotidase C-terminal domain-containing protein [Flavobacteriales bacterium]